MKKKQKNQKNKPSESEKKEREVLTILKNINMDIKNGQFIGIIG